jgi:mRNA-degrading endonuclease RelE of RelBE toxin-antitoxin system
MTSTPTFREVARLPEFERDLKSLTKRFRTLEEDLAMLIKTQLVLFHKLGQDNRGVFQVTGLPFRDPAIYKVKKFACRALKGRGANSGLRLIYAHFEETDKIELVEIYFKGEKENEDRERILRNYIKYSGGGR